MNSVVSGRPIRLANVTKKWADTAALNDITFDIPSGGFTAILGPSGCGKSTLLRSIAGLEQVSSGQIFIGDEDVTGRAADKRGLSFVFQSYALFPHLSVADNILFGLRTRGVSRPEQKMRLENVTALLGLEPYLDRKPSQLSGGQQQRVALGRAVIAERSVCLMDEPLSNLDAKLRQTMRAELRALQRKLGFTMVYVTHDQVEAITMADQVVLMNSGHIEQVATPRDLYLRPATIFAAKFIGTPPMNILSSSVLGDFGRALEAHSGTAVSIGIRPEAFAIVEQSPLEFVVTGVEYLGADALLHGVISGAAAIIRVSGQTLPETGSRLPVAVSDSDLHLFDPVSGRRKDVPDIGSILFRSGMPPVGTTGAGAPFFKPKDD